MTAFYEDRDRLKTSQNSPIAIYARRNPLNPDANRNAGGHRVSVLENPYTGT